MIRKTTGYQVFPLLSGGNDVPTLSLGNATNWDLSAIPISIGNLAYYVLGLVVTLYGSVVQTSGGSVIEPDTLTALILRNIELRNCWHGTPISQAFALGAYLPLMEYVGAGYRLPRRESLAIPAGNGTYGFARTIVIPLCIGQVAAPHHTSQLALMYKKAQFVMNVNTSSQLTTLSPGASFGTLTSRCSVILSPHSSLLLAPGTYWVDYQSPASSTQNQILLNSFGNAPTITGSEPDDGVLGLWSIGNGNGGNMSGILPGAYDPASLSQYEFPWRSQFRTNHPEAIAAAQFLALGGNGKQAWSGDSGSSTAFDSQGFPYTNGATTAVGVTSANFKPMLTQLYGFPLVQPPEDLALGTVQVARTNQSYYLTLSTGSFSGTNHTLAWHVSSWQQGKVTDWINQVVASGLADTVLGSRNVTPQKVRNGSRKQSRFNPIALVAAGAGS